MGIFEIVLFGSIIIIILAVGNYGRNTSLGYGGSLFLAIFTTPLTAFIVIYIIRRNDKRRDKSFYSRVSK